MAITPGPFAPGQICMATWQFSIGRYGWTESFFVPFGAGGFARAEEKANDIAVLRMEMCGSGVFMDNIRLSDVAVRRDADDNAVDYLARSASATDTPNFDFTVVKTAEDAVCYNPNICVVCRTENEDKVYHGAHALGGMPASLFTSGERLQNRSAWKTAFGAWKDKLVANGWGFLALNRTGAGFTDRPVDFLNHGTKTVGVDTVPVSWVKGDRIRIINAVVPGKRRGGSIVGRIDVPGANSFTFELGDTIPLNAEAGPKTIAHKEESAFIPLSFLGPEYASHRNRGRPSFSPRGRRSRK